MADWVYSEKVKEHFLEPRNWLREGENFWADAVGKVGNVRCGDEMVMMLQIRGEVITGVRWRTYGCASAIASTSVLSEMVIGKSLKEALEITPEMIADELGGLPAQKVHCSVLGDAALAKAIENYRGK
jgi:nitrogen fixation NifU-like protein